MNDETTLIDRILRISLGLYVLLMGLGSLCLCLSLVIQGSLILTPARTMLSVSATLAQTLPDAMTAADIDSLNQTHTAGQAFIALGLLGIVAGLVALMVALGLFISRSWSYPATMGLNATIIALWIVVSLLEGAFTPPRIIMIVVNALIISFLWRHTRQEDVA